MAVASRVVSLSCLLMVGAPAPSSAEILPIPLAATVLTLSGLNFNLTNYMPRQFGGVFARRPYVLR